MIIFNLATDENDPILAFTIDWINAFHEAANVTEVISTHVGSYSLPESIRVYEIGGGSPFRKAIAILKLLYHGVRIIGTTKNTLILHHMSTYTAMILGPLFRIRGFKQGLWYSHNRDSFILRAGSLAVNDIFTPTKDSFPFSSRKLHAVGHGISLKKFDLQSTDNAQRSGIVSVGRISQVKRLDLLISGVGKSGVHGAAITLIGPNTASNNLSERLVDLAAQNNVPLNFLESAPYAQIGGIISKYSMCYTGSPKTVDKSAIEGALMGCFVLSENINVLEQTGMNEIWKIIGRTPPSTISEQIQELSIYESRSDLRKILRNSAIEKNDLNSTAGRIINQMRKNG
jgi:glycosyltransferase involved in cell wall biosynthesis